MALKASIAPRNFGDTNAFARVADSSALTRLSRSCSASSKQRPPASQSAGCAPAGGGEGLARGWRRRGRRRRGRRRWRGWRGRRGRRWRGWRGPARASGRDPLLNEAGGARHKLMRLDHLWCGAGTRGRLGCRERALRRRTEVAQVGRQRQKARGVRVVALVARVALVALVARVARVARVAESSGGGAPHARGCKEREGLRRGATRRWAAAPRARAPPPSKRWRGEVSELSRRGLGTV